MLCARNYGVALFLIRAAAESLDTVTMRRATEGRVTKRSPAMVIGDYFTVFGGYQGTRERAGRFTPCRASATNRPYRQFLAGGVAR
jgi:hypothetical protein